MKKITIFFIFLFLMGGIISLADEKLINIYKNVERMAKKYTPKSYQVKVENSKFNEALKELPEEVFTGRGTPYVSILFRVNEGVKIIIENVKSEYKGLFSMYEDYIKFSGISKVQNPRELKMIIDKDKVSYYKDEKDHIILQAWDPEREEKDNNYALFYLNTENWVIDRAIYYLDGSPYVQVENLYKSYGQYFLPYKIILTNMNDNSNDVFLFKDYQFNK